MLQKKAGVTLRSLAFILGTVAAGALALPGCVSVSPDPADPAYLLGDFSVPPEEIVLTVPVMAAVERDQMLVVQLSELIDHESRGPQERAELFYELGVIYDRLGLEGSARTMFMNSLVEKPDYAPAYNFLGIYLTSAGRFQDAYEAFDASLELNPKSVYTHFARAISLYYGKRPQTALYDIEAFYSANPNDPYRLLWYYLIECETAGYETALLNLKQRYLKADKKEDYFGYHIIDYLTGLISKADLLAFVKDPAVPMYLKIERACEVYFYLGKEAMRQGNLKLAFDYFHLAERTAKHDFLEHRYALFEIRRLAKTYQLEAYRDRNPLSGDENQI